VPFVSPAWTADVRPTGAPPAAVRAGLAGYAVTPGFIQTMGMRLVGGREFTAADAVASEPVALVNEAFVRQVFGGGEVLDRHLVRSGTSASRDIDIGPIRIVGIVGDVVQARVEDGVRPAIYVPYTQHAGELQVVVRTTIAIEQIGPELRRAAAQFNPLFPVQNLRSMNDRVDATFASPRFRSLVVGAFAGVATLLAALGLYGFLVYSVRCREREFGIRVALGAGRSTALWLVLRQGLTLALAGLCVGLLATPLLSRALATMLYGLEPGDPGTFVAVAVVLVLVCIAACLIPMWRAVRVDPISILKAE
jgi:putative ABC transport system permease protein